MIVDLLRNDLGRIAETGSVDVLALFTAEAYPTVWQLTSTIEARLPPPAATAPGVVDLFRALFPCGSVTGAPKISTMAIIAGLEPAPRGVYTGAIGYVAPGGDAVFSVAIRTLVVERETGAATLGVGAGIVADSRADDEYDECLLKSAFAAGDDPGVQRTPGSFSSVTVVRVPAAAQRDFELLETVRVESGAWQHLARHLDRLSASARYFGFGWDRRAVEAAVAGASAASGHLPRPDPPAAVGRGRCRDAAALTAARAAPRRARTDARRPERRLPLPQDHAPRRLHRGAALAAGCRRRHLMEHARRDHRIDDRQRDRRDRRHPLDAAAGVRPACGHRPRPAA